MANKQFPLISLLTGLGTRESGAPGLQGFVLDILKNFINQAYKQRSAPSKTQQTEKPQELFETNEHFYIRLPIPGRVDRRRIRTYVSKSRVTVRWSPEGRERVYQLPADVVIDGTEAVTRNNVLEIKLPKEPNPDIRRLYLN